VGKRPRHIRDHEDRLDTNYATHTEIIRVVTYSTCRVARASVDIPENLRRQRSTRRGCFASISGQRTRARSVSGNKEEPQ
jgi:hypothetical protein